jgi:hypothetical protein
VSAPQLFCFREIVRGVDVEEQELRICQCPDLIQWEDTNSDLLVEANGAKIA